MAAPGPAVTAHERRYVGRFAPSPTGPLHFGSLVAAVASYADARSAGGQWLLRIEDVDVPRCSRAHEETIRAQLAAFGFEHDGEVVRQSERRPLYEHALQTLKEAGAVFACQCTRSHLQSAPRNAEQETIYPGTCRALALIDGPSRALRLRIDAQAPEISFVDRRYGLIEQHLPREVGDFVLRRADGWFAYQLAVVVDDALQGVTDVVRGADLLGNTGRQILLQRHLGFAQPRYLHLPLARNADGEKLSKQTRAAAIDAADAVPTLMAAWRFLQQPELGAADSVKSVKAFWSRALSAWNVDALVGDAR